MPLKLIAPRAGRSQNWRVRGTYLRQPVDQSAGTHEKRLATKVLNRIKDEIERGQFAKPEGPTFLSAATAYMEAGGEGRYMARALAHFATWRLPDVTQAAIDAGAAKCLPNAGNATRNRHFYTPVSAVLKHAGLEFKVKRPKGAQGDERNVWFEPGVAFDVFAAAEDIHPELPSFLAMLCYTGMRYDSEALALTCDRVRLADAYAYLPTTKTDEPRAVHLPPFCVVALANHPRGMDRGQEPVWGFRATKAAKLFGKALAAAGATLPPGTLFHVWRHTYGNWMRRFGGLDGIGMVATGVWKDQRSVQRYAHASTTVEAQKADLLPTPIRAKSVESK